MVYTYSLLVTERINENIPEGSLLVGQTDGESNKIFYYAGTNEDNKHNIREATTFGTCIDLSNPGDYVKLQELDGKQILRLIQMEILSDIGFTERKIGVISYFLNGGLIRARSKLQGSGEPITNEEKNYLLRVAAKLTAELRELQDLIDQL